MARDDRRQRLDHRLDALAGREQAEGQQHVAAGQARAVPSSRPDRRAADPARRAGSRTIWLGAGADRSRSGSRGRARPSRTAGRRGGRSASITRRWSGSGSARTVWSVTATGIVSASSKASRCAPARTAENAIFVLDPEQLRAARLDPPRCGAIGGGIVLRDRRRRPPSDRHRARRHRPSHRRRPRASGKARRAAPRERRPVKVAMPQRRGGKLPSSATWRRPVLGLWGENEAGFASATRPPTRRWRRPAKS